MAKNDQLQAAFDAFHRASAILTMRTVNAPHSEQTETQRKRVEILRRELLDLVHQQIGFDQKSVQSKRSSPSGTL